MKVHLQPPPSVIVRPAIWGDYGFRPIHYRILWWMIDMGAMRGALMRGWGKLCSEDLQVHRVTLNRAIKYLASRGFVAEVRKGTHRLVPEAFKSDADPTRVTVIKEAA